MNQKITLPELQFSLDRLPAAKSLALANADAERLFGFNDVAIERMKRFASGHNCIVSRAISCVVFEKMPLPSTGAIIS